MKNRSLSASLAWVAAASVAVLALGSGAAQARTSVYWSAGVAVPGVVVGVGNGYSVYTTPVPTYYAPPPGYYPPAVGYYAPPPAYYPPQSGYYPPPAVYYPPPGYSYGGYGYHHGSDRNPHHHYRQHDRHDRYDRQDRGAWRR